MINMTKVIEIHLNRIADALEALVEYERMKNTSGLEILCQIDALKTAIKSNKEVL